MVVVVVVVVVLVLVLVVVVAVECWWWRRRRWRVTFRCDVPNCIVVVTSAAIVDLNGEAAPGG